MDIKIEYGWYNEEYILIPTICLNFKLRVHSIQFLKFAIDFNF